MTVGPYRSNGWGSKVQSQKLIFFNCLYRVCIYDVFTQGGSRQNAATLICFKDVLHRYRSLSIYV